MARVTASEGPKRQTPGRSARLTPAARKAPRLGIERIIGRRQDLVAELARLRERGANSRLIDSAQQLLTRWWSPANWRSRAELLKTTEWLMHLELRRRTVVHSRRSFGPV